MPALRDQQAEVLARCPVTASSPLPHDQVAPSGAVSVTRSSPGAAPGPRLAYANPRVRTPRWQTCRSRAVGGAVHAEGVRDVLAVRPVLHQPGRGERRRAHRRAVPGHASCPRAPPRRPSSIASKPACHLVEQLVPDSAAPLGQLAVEEALDVGGHAASPARKRSGSVAAMVASTSEPARWATVSRTSQRLGGRRQVEVGALDQAAQVGLLGTRGRRAGRRDRAGRSCERTLTSPTCPPAPRCAATATATAPRRDLLLEAAADLFSGAGYHAVGIDDIGAAAGISGPGVYRHFAGKQALLGQLCDRAMTRMLDGAQEIPARPCRRPRRAASTCTSGFAVDERALLGVWAREQRALDDDVRRSLRAPAAGVRAGVGRRAGAAAADLEPRGGRS